MKKTDDAPVIARRISEFLYEYAPQFLTNSEHTLKGYNDALTLYIQFLEESGFFIDLPYKAPFAKGSCLRSRLRQGIEFNRRAATP